MASKSEIQRAQERLKVKSEQLAARVKVVEYREKVRDLTRKLKSMGGRVR